MKTISVNLYRFGELSSAAKEKARQWWREGQYGDTSWCECTIDDAVEQGRHLGITFKPKNQKWSSADGKRSGVDMSPCIWFSGFSSQGDGACFDGTWNATDVKAENVADGWGDGPATSEIKRIASEFKHIAEKYPSASFTVKQVGRYSHEYCTEFSVDFGDAECDGVEGAMNEAESMLIETARDFMRWIYKQLNKEWDYQNSDEAVDESIEWNEYDFYEDGTRARE